MSTRAPAAMRCRAQTRCPGVLRAWSRSSAGPRPRPARPCARALAREVLGPCARAAPARGAAHPAEQLGVGGHVQAERRLREPGAQVDGGVPKRGLNLEVEVQLDLPERRLDARFVEQRPRALV